MFFSFLVVVSSQLSANFAPRMIAKTLDEGFKAQLSENDGKTRDDMLAALETARTQRKRFIRSLARRVGEFNDVIKSQDIKRFISSLKTLDEEDLRYVKSNMKLIDEEIASRIAIIEEEKTPIEIATRRFLLDYLRDEIKGSYSECGYDSDTSVVSTESCYDGSPSQSKIQHSFNSCRSSDNVFSGDVFAGDGGRPAVFLSAASPSGGGSGSLSAASFSAAGGRTAASDDVAGKKRGRPPRSNENTDRVFTSPASTTPSVRVSPATATVTATIVRAASNRNTQSAVPQNIQSNPETRCMGGSVMAQIVEKANKMIERRESSTSGSDSEGNN